MITTNTCSCETNHKTDLSPLSGLVLNYVFAHYSDVIMSTMASHYSTVYSGADRTKHQSSTSLTFVRGINRWPVNSPHKMPVTRKIFPFDDIIMHMPDYCSAKLIFITKTTRHGQAYPITNPCRICNVTATKRYSPSYDDDNTTLWSSKLYRIVTRIIFSQPWCIWDTSFINNTLRTQDLHLSGIL